MADRSLRGMRLGAQSFQSEEGVDFVERITARYRAEDGAEFEVVFAEDAEIPARWENARTVGEFLRKYIGLRLERLRLEKAGKNRLKAVLWRIRRLAESAESLHAARAGASVTPPRQPAPARSPAR